MRSRNRLAAMGAAATLGLLAFGGLANAISGGEGTGGPPGAPGPHGHSVLPPPPPPSPPRIAEAFARAEVEIGIRPQQIDAWRDFTDAAIVVFEPPRPPKRALPDTKNDSAPGETQPFAKAVAMADDVIVRAKKAEQLKAAVEVLKTKLTPEQLKIAAEFEAQMATPPPPFGFGKMSP